MLKHLRSYLNNVVIETYNSDCEDSVNIVRSNGQIELLNISKAKFDAIDFDFQN